MKNINGNSMFCKFLSSQIKLNGTEINLYDVGHETHLIFLSKLKIKKHICSVSEMIYNKQNL